MFKESLYKSYIKLRLKITINNLDPYLFKYVLII